MAIKSLEDLRKIKAQAKEHTEAAWKDAQKSFINSSE